MFRVEVIRQPWHNKATGELPANVADNFLYVFKTGPSRARKRATTTGPGERGSLRLLA